MISSNEIIGCTKYGIDYGRDDVPTKTLMYFWADTDDEAIAYFKGISSQQEHAWDHMSLYACAIIKVISPARFLASKT